MLHTAVLDFLCVFAALSLFALIRDRARRKAFPPGPKGLPIIGNVLDVPKESQWLAYERWGRELGSDVIHVELLGTHIVVLNSVQAANDLLEKRSNIYSDRPYTVMIHELTGWGRNIGLMQYGPVWRAHRRSFNQYFQTRAIPRFHPHIAKRVQKFLNLLLETPNDLPKNLHITTGSLLLEVAYGLEVQPEHDPLLEAAEKALEGINQIGNAGAYLVDAIPILKHIPAWFPGGQFQTDAAEWKQAVFDTYNLPWNAMKEAMSAGEPDTSVGSLLLARLGGKGDEANEEIIQNVAGVAFAAGVDTGSSTLLSFFLAMMCNPGIQSAAQAEIDRVCGSGQLPQLEQKDTLPMITAILLETLRWRPAAPLGVAHRSIADDEYRGYHIPAGTITISNIWTILHDETIYPDAKTFNPRRFLTPEGQLRTDVMNPEVVFGFGRRICPGRHFVLDFLWLTMANVLATFTIEKPTDPQGKIVEPSGEYSGGLIFFPLPYEAVIKPRSTAAVTVVRSVVAEQTNAEQ